MRLPAPLLVLVLLVSGCSLSGGAGKDDAADAKAVLTAVPEVGQCVAKETTDGADVAPDFTSVVPCTKPHAYEVIGVRPVPARFLDRTSASAAAARRTDLAFVGPRATRRAVNLQRVLWPACDQALREATGVDRFTFGGKDARRLRVNPVLRNASPWLNLAPAKVWAKHPVAVCSVRYAGPKPKAAAVAPVRTVESATKEQVIRSWMRPDFPLPYRLCATQKGRRVPCASRHAVEYLLTADFKAAYGPGFLSDAIDLSALPRRPYTRVVDVCRRLYQQTGNRVPRGLKANYLYNRGDDPDARRLVMSCVLQTRGGKDAVTGFRSLR